MTVTDALSSLEELLQTKLLVIEQLQGANGESGDIPPKRKKEK